MLKTRFFVQKLSDDVDLSKETKLLMYSSIENHGCVTKTDMFHAKKQFSQKFQKHFDV